MTRTLEVRTDIDGVQPTPRLKIELARPLAVVTLALTDALLGCLQFDLSHRQRAGLTMRPGRADMT